MNKMTLFELIDSQTKSPNNAIHRMATRVTPDADSLRSQASVAPRAAIGDRGRSQEI